MIVGISGISGSGKTTLVRALGEQLDATCLFWDEFDEISKFPDDYVIWYEQGKDYTAFDYQSLADVLADLKSGKTAKHPVTQAMPIPTKHIFVDAPLGKLHDQTSQYFDICIHVDTPLDIALGRRILRDYHKSKEQILLDLEHYLTKSRKLFIAENLKKSADFVIDGCLSTMEQIDIIQNYLNAHS